MSETAKSRKRVRFGSVTVVPLSAVTDSQSSSLVNSQVISSGLRASVQYAVPFLSSLDPNSLGVATTLARKETLLGDFSDEDEEKYHVKVRPPLRATHHRGTSSSTRTQQPRLSLAPLFNSADAMKGHDNETHSCEETAPDAITIEDVDEDEEEKNTQDSATDDERGASQESRDSLVTAPPPSVDPVETKERPPCNSRAAALLQSPSQAIPTMPTLSQLVADVDDILGSPAHLLCGDDDASVASRKQAGQELPKLISEQNMGSNDSFHAAADAPQHLNKKEDEAVAATAVLSGSASASLETSTTPSLPVDPTTALLDTAESTNMETVEPSACVFCGASPEAQRRQHRAPPLLYSDGYSYHLACALWCPEVFYDSDAAHTLRGIAEAVRRAALIKCALCRRPGAAIGCTDSSCPLSFHLPCAVRTGVVLDRAGFALRCPAHSKEVDSRLHKRQRSESGDTSEVVDKHL